MQSPPETMVVMGRIHVPYGVRGWVNVFPDTEMLDGLLDYPVWWIDIGGIWQEFRLDNAKVHGDHLVAKLQGIEDRDQAIKFKGKQIAVPREQLPEPEPGEYYWSDLIGMSVENRQHELLGVIKELLATGANDVLVVSGDREHLIPFIDQTILDVDVTARRIHVDWEADF